MVVKILINGTGGDLRNPGDNNGLDDDLIVVAFQSTAYDYTIHTMSGADVIDLQDANPGDDFDEITVYSGSGNDSVYGGNRIEVVYDQSGNDLIRLSGGDDEYRAGKGKDFANGGAGTDQIGFQTVTDNAGSSSTNTSGVTCDLAKKTAQNFGVFGIDRISGFEEIYGSGGADRFFGTGGSNGFVGDGGADLLVGRGGNDSMEGNQGKDTLIGGAGADIINFNAFDVARDVARYTRITDSGNGYSELSTDLIYGFDTGGGADGDKIDLSGIDARPGVKGNQAFIFRGAGEFTSAAGEVRVVTVITGSLVQVDIDGDGASEMNIRINSVTGLTAMDFIL